MSIINENALAEMIAKAVREQRPRLEDDLTGRTTSGWQSRGGKRND